MRQIRQLIQQYAPTDTPVLIFGETGTGKDLLAKTIHGHSARKDKPFRTLNCVAIPEQLLESELFGYRKGAFTDARSDQLGLLEKAKSGTVLLDEIGDLPYQQQSKLLRVIEYNEIKRLGNPEPVKINVRFIFATNQRLEEKVLENRFRKDLYYRINILHIFIPPLRERGKDIPFLVNAFLHNENHYNRKNLKISSKALQKLLAYDYPGNVRELEGLIKCACIFCKDREIEDQDIQFLSCYSYPKNQICSELEKLYRRMTENGENFWDVLYKPFMKRDLNRREVKEVIELGLEQTDGCYKGLLSFFNIGIGEKDYKKFTDILRNHRLK